MNSYEHRYAEVAFRHISSMDPDSSDAAEYFRRSREFPSLLLQNGLRLTVAFYEAKSVSGEDSESIVRKAYADYLCHMAEALNRGELTSKSLPKDSGPYRYLSRRALHAATWFKRYSETLLRQPES
ncbi:MAG: type III-B CRISPR module-associated protein Cmr5 [Paenibacillus macerans]|nr:type III-B CRISPR module-associated protein Cmr5 [Paenibacillus macerans]KFN07068.1 CRISPR-associated family protein [Paenibacillus macerans]MBS5910520.1 type III-B CRISPR module-associated protein Cmr5 [Paenibacillus macerans]MCY7561995.1 type III-B CRISPR module-associated protein Cmr5 [Paenibacillus macerans]MDU7475375.1 type III-B CRISPR module-associated protein Cmr5 [Paenibacillus macerans]MEC0151102.1 type III-B CRISPR module-associated protein Cmr5 [Paenibacillus macerans]